MKQWITYLLLVHLPSLMIACAFTKMIRDHFQTIPVFKDDMISIEKRWTSRRKTHQRQRNESGSGLCTSYSILVCKKREEPKIFPHKSHRPKHGCPTNSFTYEKLDNPFQQKRKKKKKKGQLFPFNPMFRWPDMERRLTIPGKLKTRTSYSTIFILYA